jgi:hypothetical protein
MTTIDEKAPVTVDGSGRSMAEEGLLMERAMGLWIDNQSESRAMGLESNHQFEWRIA